MVKAVALTAVHTLAAAGKVADDGRILRPAKIAEHKPGAVFDVDQEMFEELEAEGAVRKATRADLAAAGVDEEFRKPKTGSGSTDPLDSMTKEQLLAEAEKRRVDVKPTMSKDEILAALKAAA